MSTMIVALVLLTDTVVSVTPETGSVKLLPTSRNASSERGTSRGHVEEAAAVGLICRWPGG
jgi:hypothetical protein